MHRIQGQIQGGCGGYNPPFFTIVSIITTDDVLKMIFKTNKHTSAHVHAFKCDWITRKKHIIENYNYDFSYKPIIIKNLSLDDFLIPNDRQRPQLFTGTFTKLS